MVVDVFEVSDLDSYPLAIHLLNLINLLVPLYQLPLCQSFFSVWFNITNCTNSLILLGFILLAIHSLFLKPSSSLPHLTSDHKYQYNSVSGIYLSLVFVLGAGLGFLGLSSWSNSTQILPIGSKIFLCRVRALPILVLLCTLVCHCLVL